VNGLLASCWASEPSTRPSASHCAGVLRTTRQIMEDVEGMGIPKFKSKVIQGEITSDNYFAISDTTCPSAVKIPESPTKRKRTRESDEEPGQPSLNRQRSAVMEDMNSLRELAHL
jgi:hypothetical protein